MVSKIASTFVETGAKDLLQVADAYGVRTNKTINTFVQAINEVGLKAAQALNIDPAAILNIKGSFDSLKVGGLSAKSLIDRVGDALGGITGPLRNITSDLQSGITSNLSGILAQANSPVNAIKSMVADGQKSLLGVLDSDTLQDFRAIENVVQTYSGNSDALKIFDLAGESALLSSVASSAISVGIGANDIVKSMVESASDTEVGKFALRNNIDLMAKAGNIDLISYAVDKLGSSDILNKSPDIVQKVLAGYTPSNSSNTSRENYESLNSTLNKVQPNWNTTKRGESTAADVAAYNGMSSQAKEVLSTDIAQAINISIASNYQPNTLDNMVKAQYPNTTA